MEPTDALTSPNIVLTGFMGAGKTAVGREVAQRLGRPFVDMDDLIVAQAGMSIPDIFTQHGEPYFRDREQRLLKELANQHGLVIATGGGTLIATSNRELMAQASVLICLDATAAEIEARVGQDVDRPLLSGPDRRQRIQDLLQQRAAAYAEIPYHVDVSGKSVAEAVDEVSAVAGRGLAGVLRLPVATPDGGSYDILIGKGLLRRLPLLLAERRLEGAIAIVTDTNVGPLWSEPLREALGAGRPTTVITLPAGETHKRLQTVADIYHELVAAGLDRRGLVLALGGGVIGDMAGFAAATYLRGVRFIQAPTSLLAMVDASVGGKTGVDLPEGKNLVGAFKQPEVVIIDVDLLATLPPGEFRNGLAEVIKHGIIGDPELFAQLEGDGIPSLESLVARALRVKTAIVQRDPFEQGERAFLNLGHTFGHAIEQVSGYQIPHGQGVALGLVASAELAAVRGDCAPVLADRIRALVERLGLPVRTSGFDPAAVLAAMRADKKRQGGRLRFVLPHELGRVAVHDDVTPAQALEALGSILA